MCDTIRLAGGFSRAYWRDYLEHWLFAQIYCKGLCAATTNTSVIRDLSAQSPKVYSIGRYKSILSRKNHFVHTVKSPAFTFVYKFHLSFKAIKQLILYRRPELALITLRSLWHHAV